MQIKDKQTNETLRLVFAGTPEFAAQHLASLLDSRDLLAVYTQPDRQAGRGKKITPSPVKCLAERHNIPVYQPETLKTSSSQQEFAALKPDLFIVVAYGLILPQEVLDIPRYGCINVHASLLPRWRGAAPIQRALEAGDHETGVTIMQMDKGLDTGDMLYKAKCTIDANDTAATLHDKIARLGANALAEVITQIESGTCKAEQQDHQAATYAEKLSKAEAAINWLDSANTVERKIRSFNPYPIAYTTLGKERVKIWSANSLPDDTHGNAGEITDVSKNAIMVSCGQGTLAITQLQLPGKKAMPVQALLNSEVHKKLFSVGSRFT